jgi:hypothetical protein
MAEGTEKPCGKGYPAARPLRRVVIKEEYVALTGDKDSAILLNQIDYWAKRCHDIDKYLAEEEARASHNDIQVDFPYTYGWIYKTAKELSEECMLDLDPTTVRAKMKRMIEKGWISERNNPDPRFKWDKTKQYRFNAKKVAEDLGRLGYPLEGWVLQGHVQNRSCEIQDRSCEIQDRSCEIPDRSCEIQLRSGNIQDGSCEIPDGTRENPAAIPKIITEITTEITNKDQDQLIVSSLRSDTINSAPAFQASGAAEAAASCDYPKPENKNSMGREGSAKPAEGPTPGDARVSNRSLIAELVNDYREAVPPEKHRDGDYAFIGLLYSEFGYDRVLLGINELNYKIAAGFVPNNPMVYLKAIMQGGSRQNGAAPAACQADQHAGPGGEIARLEEFRKRLGIPDFVGDTKCGF